MDPVVFRGPGERGDWGAPLLLQRTDEDFVGSIFEQLRGPAGLDSLSSSVVTDSDHDGVLKFYQPVHRTFHVAVLELACKVPGLPRLDPDKIDSAGLVVRRVSRVVDTSNQKRTKFAPFGQGWLRADRLLRGWVTFDSKEQAELDPDPARRKVPDAGTPIATARLLALLGKGQQPVSESTSPLFVMPSDVCAASGRTLLFGVVPTASLERSELPRPAGQKLFSADDMAAMLPPHFSAGVSVSFGDLADRSLTFEQAATRETTEARQLALARATQKPAPAQYLKDFLSLLRQLATQFRVFEDSPEARHFLSTLDNLDLPFAAQPKLRSAGAYLKAAATFFVLEPNLDGQQSFPLPTRWPALPVALAQDLRGQLADFAERGFAAMQPRAARFEDSSAYYELRAFVRIKSDHADCPPQLFWSDPTLPFSIAPWYEAGVVPPVLIQLPDITRENVKALRPNVALKLPRRLFNFLNDNDPKDLIDGKGHPGLDIGVDWICGFNISIIFLCAFIVLFIFLFLLNIVFWWLPFIKICFPLPRIKSEDAA